MWRERCAVTELGCFEDYGVGGDDVVSRLSALAKLCTGGFYHGARRDARAERPKDVILEDCSSDERKGGLQFLLDESANSPPEECETLRASRRVARSQPLD
eukprot:scaffold2346_cov71-Phaeocystis_antarctica.AAC.7